MKRKRTRTRRIKKTSVDHAMLFRCFCSIVLFLLPGLLPQPLKPAWNMVLIFPHLLSEKGGGSTEPI